MSQHLQPPNGNGHNMPHFAGGDPRGAEDQRTLYDYWAMLRERIWGFATIFLTVFVAAIIYVVTTTELYTGVSKLQILRDDPDALQDGTRSLDLQEIRNVEDFNSQIEVLQSTSLIMAVAERLDGDMLERFMEPYENRLRFLGPLTPIDVLASNRTIEPIRQSLTLTVSFSHPDPELSAVIANYFAQEFIDRNLRLLVESSMDAVDALKVRTDQQGQEVERIEQELAAYVRSTQMISLNDKSDIDHQELAQLNEGLTRIKIDLDASRSRWNLVQTYREEGRYLWDLPFIAIKPQLQALLSKRSVVKVEIAAMSERYREKHPKMAEALQNLGQVEAELLAAVTSAVGEVRAEYENLNSTYDKTAERVLNKEQEILALQDKRVAYDALIRQREVAEVIHQGMLQRMEIETAKANMKKPNVVIIDEAYPPIFPSSPNVPLALAMGLFGGFGLAGGYVIAFGVLDERVKTATAVESQLHLPLLAVIPKTIKMDSFERARISRANSDRRVAESFRSVYSNLRINESKGAGHYQVLIITSTIPSEGKSFCASNLAITCASHGEKTLLVDADLRMPAVAQSLGVHDEVEKRGGGLVGYFAGKVNWEDVILHEVHPGLDVLGSTRRGGNPSEIMNSSEFAEVINALRENYDRIILDTPPMGVVSDALAMCPVADGCIYVIKHNYVKIRQIKSNIKRLTEATLPIVGALMNHVGRSGTAYYNSNYYSYNYDRYYSDPTLPQDQEPVITPRSTRRSSGIS